MSYSKLAIKQTFKNFISHIRRHSSVYLIIILSVGFIIGLVITLNLRWNRLYISDKGEYSLIVNEISNETENHIIQDEIIEKLERFEMIELQSIEDDIIFLDENLLNDDLEEE